MSGREYICISESYPELAKVLLFGLIAREFILEQCKLKTSEIGYRFFVKSISDPEVLSPPPQNKTLSPLSQVMSEI